MASNKGGAPRRPARDPQKQQLSAVASLAGRYGGRIRVDLAREPDPGRRIQQLVAEPAGTRVVLVVAPGQLVPLAVDDLRAHGRHLGRIDVECPDSGTRVRWLETLRRGATTWLA